MVNGVQGPCSTEEDLAVLTPDSEEVEGQLIIIENRQPPLITATYQSSLQ